MSSRNKKYYWLSNDFFQNPKIKKLRKSAAGDTCVIIYQKLLLLALKTDGVLQFENIENSFEKELALITDEYLENIKITLNFLADKGLIKKIDNRTLQIIDIENSKG